MKILLTGVTGYIAQRLLPVLLENGNEVVCCVRDSNRFNRKNYQTSNLSIIEVDFLNRSTLSNIPDDINVAYYQPKKAILKIWKKSVPPILKTELKKPMPDK